MCGYIHKLSYVILLCAFRGVFIYQSMHDAAQHSTRWGRERQMYRKVKTDDNLESDDEYIAGTQVIFKEYILELNI